ncbi:MAG: cytochrome b N-terminal domain-containing protein [Planctomycetota bacterium]
MMVMHPVPAEAESKLPPDTKLRGKLGRLFLERYPVWPIVDHMAQKAVPRHRHSVWYNMGGIALFLLVLQFVTGALLMVYYRPAQPWGSVQRIVMEVPYGNLIRSIHHWSANLLVLALFVHMFSTLLMKAYRRPREFTWLTGLGLIGLMLAFGFSGYLLPWEELSFFATRVGVSEIEKAPVVGSWLAGLARGGDDVTIDTIGRFYLLHVTVLPLALLGLLGLHLVMIQIQGVSEPDTFAALPPERKRYAKFFGEFLLAEIPIWLLLGTFVVVLSVLWPKGLAPEADVTASAPQGIKPEWYFLSQFQLLKMFPGRFEAVGMILLTLLPIGAVLVPFVDRSVPSDARGRLVHWLAMLALAGLLFFTIWGWLS